MQLYTILFDDTCSPESRIALANSIESMHWEVKRRWTFANAYLENPILNSLDLTNWDENDLPLPPLPSGCFLKKL